MRGILFLLCYVPFIVKAQTNTFPSSGNVGIGTTAPSVLLHISKTSPLSNQFIIEGTGSGAQQSGIDFKSNTATVGTIGFLPPFEFRMGSTIANSSYFTTLYSGGNEVLRLTNSNVGIGTTTPGNPLTVIGTNNVESPAIPRVLAVGDPSAPTKTISLGYNTSLDAGVLAAVHATIGWKNILINPNGGNVGIGTTSTSYTLDVGGITRSKSYFVDAGNSAYSGDYQFLSSGTYRGRFIWYSSSYAGLPSNSITVENPTGVPIAHFFENGNTAFGGSVAIGTTNDHGYKLAVNGNVLAQKLRVTQTDWPDYVFHPSYKLPALKELEDYIKQHQHLPEVPSAKEVEQNGLDVGDNQALLLKKIEELTLYIIEQDKKIESQQNQIQQLLDIKKELAAINAKLQNNN